jgi:replication initiation protein RepC
VVIEATGDQKLHDLSSEGDIGVTPNNNTTHKSIYISKTQPTENPDQGAKSKNKHVVKIAYDKKYVFADRAKKLGLDVYNQRGADIVQGEILASISIGLLQVACRKAQIMIDMHFDNWAALGRAGETLRRMIGLSEAVWGDGRLRVGLYGASAIIATILEKAIRDPQQISNPAGYFRAMIDRAVEGKLNLERSLFGLAESSDDNAKIHGGT